MTVTFESGALREYQEAAQYSEERFGLGRDFVAAVQAALETISSDPTRFQPVGREIRIFRMKRFPYYLFFHFDAVGESVTIYAVAHHKKQNDYWRGRLGS
jgi:toxin ParE1/3/4